MNPAVLHVAVKLALLALLVGVLVRRRDRECRSFPLYVAAVLVCETLVALFPERLFVWSVWVWQQALFDLLKLAVALELAHRAFRLFPGARPVARLVCAGIVLATTASVIVLTADRGGSVRDTFVSRYFEFEPRIINGTIWLFAATARLVLFFNVPWSDFQRAISLGFTAYMVVFVTGLNIQRMLGSHVPAALNLVDGSAYLLLTAYWAREAWKPAAEGAVSPVLLARLAGGRA